MIYYVHAYNKITKNIPCDYVRTFPSPHDMIKLPLLNFLIKFLLSFPLHWSSNDKPVNLKVYIKEIEKNLNIKSKKKLLPLQTGDVYKTFSNSNKLYKFIKFKPKTDVKYGIKEVVKWYINYFNIKKNAS